MYGGAGEALGGNRGAIGGQGALPAAAALPHKGLGDGRLRTGSISTAEVSPPPPSPATAGGHRPGPRPPQQERGHRSEGVAWGHLPAPRSWSETEQRTPQSTGRKRLGRGDANGAGLQGLPAQPEVTAAGGTGGCPGHPWVGGAAGATLSRPHRAGPGEPGDHPSHRCRTGTKGCNGAGGKCSHPTHGDPCGSCSIPAPTRGRAGETLIQPPGAPPPPGRGDRGVPLLALGDSAPGAPQFGGCRRWGRKRPGPLRSRAGDAAMRAPPGPGAPPRASPWGRGAAPYLKGAVESRDL